MTKLPLWIKPDRVWVRVLSPRVGGVWPWEVLTFVNLSSVVAKMEIIITTSQDCVENERE